MRIAYFTHSLASCWNHGNAHFLRGILRELIARGNDVRVYEPAQSWSLGNLLADHGKAGLTPFHAAYPGLSSILYRHDFDAEEACDGADLVLVHEWTAPDIVGAIGRTRIGSRFTLLFHDTHHRGVSDPSALAALDLSAYDGVLAFGETLSEVYRRLGWASRVWTWHEAADATLFHPLAEETPRQGLVWIGNWGDGERTAELETFLLAPAQAAALPLDVHGVRYPQEALALLTRHGATYRGWLPNALAPATFARHLATIHVPRRFYVDHLPGIPTIRVFEALACGIPLLSAPWQDTEHLFRAGTDYLVANTCTQMHGHLTALTHDPALRASLAAHGLETIRARHTCAHRVDELLAIVAGLKEGQGLCPRAITRASRPGPTFKEGASPAGISDLTDSPSLPSPIDGDLGPPGPSRVQGQSPWPSFTPTP